MGCDVFVWWATQSEQVSIHAPVWGATKMTVPALQAFLVSIHAPVWGATKMTVPALQAFLVSIHAPVWGATNLCQRKGMGRSFNPRTRVGCDPCPCLLLPPPTLFQSTHPCGVRQRPRTYRPPFVCFNPRTRVGCDCFKMSVSYSVKVSIHAPVWGATKK